MAGETFEGEALAANYRTDGYEADWRYTVTDMGETLTVGGGSAQIIPGEVNRLGTFKFNLPFFKEAHQLKVKLELLEKGVENTWDFWVYPQIEELDSPQIITCLDECAEDRLRSGERLLLLPENIPDSIPGVFTTVFWNPQMKKQTGTFGICCEPSIPALKGFPNEGYTQWQWWDVLKNSRAMNLDMLPVTPLIRVIDSFMSNRKLGILFEASVEKGSLLVCSAGLQETLQDRPVSCWLKACLLRYLESDSFCPQERLELKQLRSFLEH